MIFDKKFRSKNVFDFFSYNMSLEVLGVQFLAPNSTLRGGLRGFSEKTRDFR